MYVNNRAKMEPLSRDKKTPVIRISEKGRSQQLRPTFLNTWQKPLQTLKKRGFLSQCQVVVISRQQVNDTWFETGIVNQKEEKRNV